LLAEKALLERIQRFANDMRANIRQVPIIRSEE